MRYLCIMGYGRLNPNCYDVRTRVHTCLVSHGDKVGNAGFGRLMCTQDCRTWLWGGGGNPTYDDGGGQCSCVCDDERWSDHNLLGRASCVPVLAHAIFGWVGVALSAAALCHAAYHLHMQVSRRVLYAYGRGRAYCKSFGGSSL